MLIILDTFNTVGRVLEYQVRPTLLLVSNPDPFCHFIIGRGGKGSGNTPHHFLCQGGGVIDKNHVHDKKHVCVMRRINSFLLPGEVQYHVIVCGGELLGLWKFYRCWI